MNKAPTPENEAANPVEQKFSHFKKTWIYSIASIIVIAFLGGGNLITNYTTYSTFFTNIFYSHNACSNATGDNKDGTAIAALGTRFCTYTGHKGGVNAVAWSPDGQRIASAGKDGIVQVWNATTGANIVTYRGHKKVVNAVAWSPDGQRIASGSQDGTVQVWYVDNVNRSYAYNGIGTSTSPVTTLAWSPDGQLIAFGRGDGNVWVFGDAGQDLTDFGVIRSSNDNKPLYNGSVNAIVWSSDSETIAFGGYERGTDQPIVQIWNVVLNEHIFDYKIQGFYSIDALAWSPDGKFLLIVSETGDVHAVIEQWDVAKRKSIQIFVLGAPGQDGLHSESLVSSIAWSCDNTQFAMAVSAYGPSFYVEVDSIATKQAPFRYKGHTNKINAVSWSPDGMHIASASEDGTVQIWQANKESKCKI